jgi:very-short-patch-repair endonuclease
VADGALRDGRVSRRRLLQAADELRGPRRAHRLTVLRAADGRAENPFESAARAVLLEGGITGFEPQVLVRAPGFEARVDLAHRRKRVVIEADGFEYHAATQPAFNRDIRRYTELVRHDWRVLRFTWHQVMARPQWVVEMVGATLDAATTPSQVHLAPVPPATIRRRS